MSGFENRVHRRQIQFTSRTSGCAQTKGQRVNAHSHGGEKSTQTDESVGNEPQRAKNRGALQHNNCGGCAIVADSGAPSSTWQVEEECGIVEKLAQSYAEELQSEHGARFLQAVERATQEECTLIASSERLQWGWNAREGDEAVHAEGGETEHDDHGERKVQEEDHGLSDALVGVEEKEEQEKRVWGVEHGEQEKRICGKEKEKQEKRVWGGEHEEQEKRVWGEKKEEHEKQVRGGVHERFRKHEYDETERLRQAGKKNKRPGKRELDMPASATSVSNQTKRSSEVDSIASANQEESHQTTRTFEADSIANTNQTEPYEAKCSFGSWSSAEKQSQPPSCISFKGSMEPLPHCLTREPSSPTLPASSHGPEQREGFPQGKEPQRPLSRSSPVSPHSVERGREPPHEKEPQRSPQPPAPAPSQSLQPRRGAPHGNEPQRSLSRPSPVPPHGVEPRGGPSHEKEPQESLWRPPPVSQRGLQSCHEAPHRKETQRSLSRPLPVPSHGLEPRRGPPPPPEMPPSHCVQELAHKREPAGSLSRPPPVLSQGLVAPHRPPRGQKPAGSLSRPPPLPVPAHGLEPHRGPPPPPEMPPSHCEREPAHEKEPAGSLLRPFPVPLHGLEPRHRLPRGQEPAGSISRPFPVSPHGVKPRGSLPLPPETSPAHCAQESQLSSSRPQDAPSHDVEPSVGGPHYWRNKEVRDVDAHLQPASRRSSFSGSSAVAACRADRGRGSTISTSSNPCVQLKEFLDAKYPGACEPLLTWRMRDELDGFFCAEVLTKDGLGYIGPRCSSKEEARNGAAVMALRALSNRERIAVDLQGLGAGINLKGIHRKYPPQQNITNLVMQLGGTTEWRVRQHPKLQGYNAVITISLPDRQALHYDSGFHTSIKKGKYATSVLALNDLGTACGL